MKSKTAHLQPASTRKAGGRSIIIIPCSARKRRQPAIPVRAIDRYDGPFFQVLRKAMREGTIESGVHIVIISAKYGLIDADMPIPFYDQRFSVKRATVLGPEVREKLKTLIEETPFNSLRVNLRKDYAKLIEEMPILTDAIWASGSIGARAATLKQWLRE